jgi:hypothetical protein
MAHLSELIPYLEKGCTLRCDTGDMLIPDKDGSFALIKPETEKRYYEPEYFSLAGVKKIRSLWEWGVVFLDEKGKEYTLTDLAEIDSAIEQGRKRSIFGEISR